MIVVDTSALVAIFSREPDWTAFFAALRPAAGISVATVLEASIVVRSRKSLPPQRADAWLDAFLAAMHIRIEPVTLADLGLAREAHARFGKGTGHKAQLNYGDCFSYALARRLDAPLLYKGADFIHTDIRGAL
jgi:ribonuclease VapC